MYLLMCLILFATQDVTRQEEIQAIRVEKAAAKPVYKKRGWFESTVLWMEKKGFRESMLTPNRRSMSIRPRFGGLTGVSGPAPGVQLDAAAIHLSGWLSTRKFQQYELQVDLPSLLNGAAFASGGVRYRNQPQLSFFGLGANSAESNRAEFLFEDVAYSVGGGVRPLRNVRVGAEVAWLQVNVGPGTHPDVRNIDFAVAEPDFVRTGLFAEYDWRDERGSPRRGGLYRMDYNLYNDWRSQQFDFRRFQAEAHQYIPFTNGHRVIATRFALSLDDPVEGRQVPFYLQRTLGGFEDLRGFRPFRFRDLNQLLMNVEYRWKAWAGLDMVAFADAGKVFSERRDFNLNSLETSYGIGFRLNTAKTTIFRVDAARSREGYRWFAGVGTTFR